MTRTTIQGFTASTRTLERVRRDAPAGLDDPALVMRTAARFDDGNRYLNEAELRAGVDDIRDAFATATLAKLLAPASVVLAGGTAPLALRILAGRAERADAAAVAPTEASPAPPPPVAPPAPSAPPAPRRAAAVEALDGRLSDLRTRAAGARSEIESLEGKLAVLDGDIARKKTEIGGLESRKNTLLAEIERLDRRRRRNLLLGALLGGASGVAMVQIISTHREDVAKLNAQIAAARQEQAELQAMFSSYEAERSRLRGELSELKRQESAVEGAIAALRSGGPADDGLERGLAHEVVLTGQLVTNLRAQVAVLRDLQRNASAFDAALDGVIRHLEADVAALEAQRDQAKQLLFESLIDLVIQASGQSPTVDVAGVPVSKKRLLVAGTSALREAFDAHVRRLAHDLVAKRIVDAGGSQALAADLARRLVG